MKTKSISFLGTILFLFAITPIKAELIYSNDFEGAIEPEWSTSITDNSYPAATTRFLGRFMGNGNDAVLTLSTLPGNIYSLKFDLFILDSWDGSYPSTNVGPDYFNVTLGSSQLFHHTFNNYWGPWQGCVYQDYQDFREPDQPRASIGWSSYSEGFVDAIYRNIQLDFMATDATSQIRFGYQGVFNPSWDDESWGIDNVNVSVPEPATFSLLILGGLSAIHRRRA